jgi:tetratricopeptide (TPR) repeat protein
LESWKEIAAYFNRSERTVRRWEPKEGLPVHRLQHDKRGSVYAYTRELDSWRESRRQLLDADVATAPQEPAVGRRRWPWLVATAALLIAAFAGVWQRTGPAAATAPAPNPDAVRLVQLARFAGNAGRVQVHTGIRYYQEAIRLDPSYAAAWSGLAAGQVALTWFGDSRSTDTMGAAARAAYEALRLNPSSSVAWMVLGWKSHYVDWEHESAESHFRKAIELAPNNAPALSWFGDVLVNLRRIDEARVHYKRAQNASPRWLEPITFAANTFTFTGNPEMAILEQRRVLESEPNFGLGIHFLGRSYLAAGDYTQALERLRKSDDLLGQVPFSRGDLAYALGVSGQRVEAETMLAEMMETRARGYYPAFAIAQIHLGLGDRDTALEWLSRAADERHLGFYLPTIDPIYDPVRAHPRFKALMRRINIH